MPIGWVSRFEVRVRPLPARRVHVAPFAGAWVTLPSKAPRPNPIARTPQPFLLDLSPSAATNPSPLSYHPAVAVAAPSDLPRQPPPLRLLGPPALSVQAASFLPPRPSPLSPSSSSVPCCSRCSSAQAVRKQREEERPRLEKPREEGLKQRRADASQLVDLARRHHSCPGRGRP